MAEVSLVICLKCGITVINFTVHVTFTAQDAERETVALGLQDNLQKAKFYEK